MRSIYYLIRPIYRLDTFFKLKNCFKTPDYGNAIIKGGLIR